MDKHLQSSLTRLLTIFFAVWVLSWGLASSIASADSPEKITIGWLETVQIVPENFQLAAKIDTGADNSSLSITNPTEFQKEEQSWIRFTIPLGEEQAITLERPIKRYTRIKRKGAASLKRTIVLMDLCVGTLFKEDVPVNLADRTGFKFPMLIGRSFLKGSAIVDSDLTLTQSSICEAAPE